MTRLASTTRRPPVIRVVPHALLVLVLATASSRAAPDDARAQYVEGARLFELADYENAIAKFEAAYAISGAPELLLNIAQAYRLWGPAHCADALRLYRTYLDKRPDSPHRAEVLRWIEAMQACAPVAAMSPPAAQPPPPSPPTSDASTASGWRTGAWITAGTAAAATVVASASWYSTSRRSRELDDVCTDGVCPPAQASSIDRYNRMRAVAVTSMIVGAVAAAVSVYCVVRVRRSSTVSAWVAGSSAGVHVAF